MVSLQDQLADETDPTVRKLIKAAIYERALVLLDNEAPALDPDPLTVIDPDATDRNAVVGRTPTDLHHQHPAPHVRRHRLRSVLARLDGLAMVPRHTSGGS